MLRNGNLQFTNSMRLNDPFDCHPSLFSYANVPSDKAAIWGNDLITKVEKNKHKELRHKAWICSLSKVYNSVLMWSYYNNHKGICIGLDKEKTKKCLAYIHNEIYIGAHELEVKYKDVIEKPDSFSGDYISNFKYLLSTKAKDWEHEQEVRFLLINPMPSVVPHHPSFVTMTLPPNKKYQDESTNWEDVCVYADLSSDCFNSVYMGVNIENKDRERIIEAAKKRNPNIKIYQMNRDSEAFRLKEEKIEY